MAEIFKQHNVHALQLDIRHKEDCKCIEEFEELVEKLFREKAEQKVF